MDKLPASLSALVDQARTAHDPNDEDARRVGKALGVCIAGFQVSSAGTDISGGEGVGGVAASPSAAAPTAQGAQASVGSAVAGLTSVSKAVAATIVAVAALAGAIAVGTLWPDEPARTTAPLGGMAQGAKPAAGEPALPPGARVAQEAQDEPAAAARALASTPRAGPPEARREPAIRAAKVEPKAHARKSQRAAPDEHSPTPSAPKPAARQRAAEPTPPVPAVGMAEELTLIRQATQALRDGKPAIAREILGQHAARFPSGALLQERMGLTVLALCEEGRLPEAKPLRERFLREAPDAPLASRVRNACREASR